jgi:hypothetical protein
VPFSLSFAVVVRTSREGLCALAGGEAPVAHQDLKSRQTT